MRTCWLVLLTLRIKKKSAYRHLQSWLINTLSPLFEPLIQLSARKRINVSPKVSVASLNVKWYIKKNKSSRDCLILAALFFCHQSWNTVILKHLINTLSPDELIHIHRLTGDSKGPGEHTIAASLGPNLWLQLWRYCCCSGLSVTSLPPLLPLYSAPVAEPAGLCCSATAVLRFPQWSFEGNKTLPQDKQQREPGKALGGWGEKEGGRQWEKVKVVVHSKLFFCRI